MYFDRIIVAFSLLATVTAQVPTPACVTTCAASTTLFQTCGVQLATPEFATCACANGAVVQQIITCCDSDPAGQQLIKNLLNSNCGGATTSSSAPASTGTANAAPAASISSPPAPAPTPAAPVSKTGLSSGAIAGIVFGGLAGIGAAVGLITYCCRRQRRKRQGLRLLSSPREPSGRFRFGFTAPPSPSSPSPSPLPSILHINPPPAALSPQYLDRSLASQDPVGIQQPMMQQRQSSVYQYSEPRRQSSVYPAPVDVPAYYYGSRFSADTPDLRSTVSDRSRFYGVERYLSFQSRNRSSGSRSEAPSTAPNPSSQSAWFSMI